MKFSLRQYYNGSLKPNEKDDVVNYSSQIAQTYLSSGYFESITLEGQSYDVLVSVKYHQRGSPVSPILTMLTLFIVPTVHSATIEVATEFFEPGGKGRPLSVSRSKHKFTYVAHFFMLPFLFTNEWENVAELAMYSMVREGLVQAVARLPDHDFAASEAGKALLVGPPPNQALQLTGLAVQEEPRLW